MCAVAYASDGDRRARAATGRESAARGELAVARLAGFRAQLRPHFLFNALNTASVLAARADSDGARRVLTGLAELLRYVMRGADQPETAESTSPAMSRTLRSRHWFSSRSWRTRSNTASAAGSAPRK